jgi:hypothetical protein
MPMIQPIGVKAIGVGDDEKSRWPLTGTKRDTNRDGRMSPANEQIVLVRKAEKVRSNSSDITTAVISK